ncbi:MAG: hypothetical protein HDR20_04560 [Lachnospiraceae bacterium]|nr:hypothetical protein [Lachnospiraceae bacterium]
MKIGEARQIYSAQIKEFQQQKISLAKQKKDLEHKMNILPDGKEQYANEAATLELSYNAVSEKYDEYRNFMEKIMEQHMLLFNAEATKQQGEAMEEYALDQVKLMEVARRIGRGDIVPASDEQKLMEYSMELYMSAKNLAMLSELQDKDRKKHDSLWDDDEEKPDNPDPMDVANDGTLQGAAPEIVSAEEVVASAVGDAGSAV